MTTARTLQNLLGEPVTLEGSVSGGCINAAVRGRTASGRAIFVKSNDAAPPGMFEAEAAGLRALAAASGGPRIPEVLAVSEPESLLVLEWLERGRPGPGYWERFGRELAALHRTTHSHYGFASGDNTIGSAPQPNPLMTDWLTFFRDHRLDFQRRLLRRKGRCPAALDRALDQVLEQLDRWLDLPDEHPALLHGDLWSGNAMCGAKGEPIIFDPAAYFGCREADLAMTELFGGFDRHLLSAYEEAFPLAPGYPERRDLYNLYHVLNHANLFGGSYASQALSIAKRYT